MEMNECVPQENNDIANYTYLPIYNTSVFDIIVLPYTSSPEYSFIYLPIINIRYFRYHACHSDTTRLYLRTFSIFCQKSIRRRQSAICMRVHYMVGEFAACTSETRCLLILLFLY